MQIADIRIGDGIVERVSLLLHLRASQIRQTLRLQFIGYSRADPLDHIECFQQFVQFHILSDTSSRVTMLFI